MHMIYWIVSAVNLTILHKNNRRTYCDNRFENRDSLTSIQSIFLVASWRAWTCVDLYWQSCRDKLTIAKACNPVLMKPFYSYGARLWIEYISYKSVCERAQRASLRTGFFNKQNFGKYVWNFWIFKVWKKIPSRCEKKFLNQMLKYAFIPNLSRKCRSSPVKAVIPSRKLE